VIATTRFPNTAIEAYRQERDFDTFRGRLHVYGLDLRDVTGLEAFTRYITMKYHHVGIDILINNACQTVRRPVSYYVPFVQKEQAIYQNSDPIHKSILHGCYHFESIRRQILLDQQQQRSQSAGFIVTNPPVLLDDSSNAGDVIAQPNKELIGVIEAKSPDINPNDNSAERNGELVNRTITIATTSRGNYKVDNDDDRKNDIDKTATIFECTGLTHSTAMSQMTIIPEDVGVHDHILPSIHDINGQPLDLRLKNSWLLKMDEVSTPELMECMLINAIAPFVLNSRLKPLMTEPNDDSRPDRYIINVSAMEGKVNKTMQELLRMIACSIESHTRYHHLFRDLSYFTLLNVILFSSIGTRRNVIRIRIWPRLP
jgi:hypothetical protein